MRAYFNLFIVLIFITSFIAGCKKKEVIQETAPPLEANFEISGDDRNAPCDIIFQNRSQNATQYLWEFGDFSTSTEESPTHTYTRHGYFTVRLTVTGKEGNKICSKIVKVREGIGTFTDSRDGNVYRTITKGNQTWMIDNLAYLPKIDSVSFGSELAGMENESFYYIYDCFPNGSTESEQITNAKKHVNYKKYGVLYNFSAALTACPPGWHLPSDDEWKELEAYLGVSSNQIDQTNFRGEDAKVGKRMRYTIDWYPGYEGTNETDFSALPGGFRSTLQNFAQALKYGCWRTSTTYSYDAAWIRSLTNNSGIFRDSYSKHEGYSVRCVKD